MIGEIFIGVHTSYSCHPSARVTPKKSHPVSFRVACSKSEKMGGWWAHKNPPPISPKSFTKNQLIGGCAKRWTPTNPTFMAMNFKSPNNRLIFLRHHHRGNEYIFYLVSPERTANCLGPEQEDTLCSSLLSSDPLQVMSVQSEEPFENIFFWYWK